MLNLLVNGGGDGLRRVFMVPSVQALSLKNACCCPGLLCNSVSNLNIFMNMAVTCRMKIIANCHGRRYIKTILSSKREIFFRIRYELYHFYISMLLLL